MITGTADWVILGLTTLLVGVGKVGFSGLSLVTISVFAGYFGKESVGVLLPLLVVADCTVYPVMRRHGSWRQVWPLLPPALVGIGISLWLLPGLSDELAKPVIASIILVMLLISLWQRYRPDHAFFRSRGLGVGAALCGGVATTLANAAGPVMNIYLLTRGLPKLELVGVAARFFLLINLLKLPLLGSLSLITADSLWLNLQLAPLVIIGVVIGKGLLQIVPQRLFSTLIIIFAVISATRLYFF